MLRAVFMGTPEFALPALNVAAERTKLDLVVTQPDRPAGRGRKLTPPPVKARALELGLEVAQPEGSVSRAVGERLVAAAPDVVIVAAFGKILGRKILRAPRLGCLNIHASLLPRHRGASPPAWAILRGDAVTGVSIQQMVPELDAGDVLGQRETAIAPDESTGELLQRLSPLGAELLDEVLTALEAGRVVATPQDPALVTFAPPLRKTDGEIDWCRPAQHVHDHIRAMNPWPMASTRCSQGRLRIHRARVALADGVQGEPGEVIQADKGGITIACGVGSIEVLEAQREGKKVMSSKDLVCGRLVGACERLGALEREEERSS